jgi:hypothetical protein
MTKLIDAMRTENVLTENGMITNSSTLDSCLDLFFMIGAVRPLMKTGEGRERLIRKFEAARNQDGLITRKLMFWARDAREGAGEREAFRVLLRHASEKYPDEVITNIHLIAEFGRWDDVFVTFGTPVEKAAIELIRKNLNDGNGLLAKWMPRTGGKVPTEKRLIANKVRIAMGMSAKEFRKFLVERTNVIETSMCKKDYTGVEYGKVPSLAMARYQKAFMKNDASGFENYKNALIKGEAKINAGAVYPYDIIKTLRFRGSEDVAMKQWEALPNYMEGSNERVIPVCDVSGSMSTAVSGGNTSAMDVCLSLGLYISERNVGPFKDAFITFSARPQLQVLTGNLRSRLQQLERAQWDMNTNLEATFDLILNQAVKHNVSQEEMPTCILIMSDMEFDSCTGRNTAYGMIEEKYARAGYQLPKVVFWNIASRHDNFPVQKHQTGTGLVSGFSPSILKSVLTGDVMNPVQIMLRTVNTPRYESIQ